MECNEGLVTKHITGNDEIDIWLIGNTGVRNPWRVFSGFKVYKESGMIGKLQDVDDQRAFKRLLFEKGEIGGDATNDESASIVRKYRLIFEKIGLIYPKLTGKYKNFQDELGEIYGITPMGENFYYANTVSAQQECFLRALIIPVETMRVPVERLCVPVERLCDKYYYYYYSPLLWVLSIMFELEKRTGKTDIYSIEFALCVQTTNPNFSLNEVVNTILQIRENRKNAENKKRFDSELIEEFAARYPKKKDNFRQYEDMNKRYLIATGIVKRAGRGLALVPEYRVMARELIEDTISELSLVELYRRRANGATLPTDSTETAKKVLDNLITELESYGIEYSLPDLDLSSAKNINTVRNSIKQDVDKYKEELYARRQSEEWQEIYEYMNLLIVNNGKEKELGEDYFIKVPKSEAAAYLEWVLWRAFLAINHITNKPYEARGFNIDQDYLPVSTAPGGGPDLIFEFEKYVIVIEVTMSTNSRQEAMEGEPVRRHVADLVIKYDKPVYGIFIANKIDSNTAETFRIGVWYTRSDEKMALKIVPLTLKQFSEFFRAIFVNGMAHPDNVLKLFNKCFSSKDEREAPEWKGAIEKIVAETVEQYMA